MSLYSGLRIKHSQGPLFPVEHSSRHLKIFYSRPELLSVCTSYVNAFVTAAPRMVCLPLPPSRVTGQEPSLSGLYRRKLVIQELASGWVIRPPSSMCLLLLPSQLPSKTSEALPSTVIHYSPGTGVSDHYLNSRWGSGHQMGAAL